MDLDDDCPDCAIIREYKSCEDPFLRAEYAAAHGLSESYIRSLPCWRGCVAARRRRLASGSGEEPAVVGFRETRVVRVAPPGRGPTSAPPGRARTLRRRRRSVVTVTTTTSWSPFRVVTVIRIEK